MVLKTDSQSIAAGKNPIELGGISVRVSEAAADQERSSAPRACTATPSAAGRAEPPPRVARRDDHEHDDRRDVRAASSSRGRSAPRLIWRACSSGASACSAPKKYAPTRHSSGPPEREDDERDRDPAGAAGDPVDPLRRDREREASRRRRRRARRRRSCARSGSAVTLIPIASAARRRLADRAHVEARAACG